MPCRYTLDSATRYRQQDELHLAPESKIGSTLIKESLSTYQNFSNSFRAALNLQDLHTIDTVYKSAMDQGIFELATKVRQTFFGKDIHFYGVTYLWDMCMESCVYCPAAIQNRQRTKYKPLALSLEDAITDVTYIMRDGHRHICVLTGEDPLRYPPNVLADYIRAFDQLGLKEIILNVEPPAAKEDFALWREAAQNTALQFRVFQETYNREKYAEIHPVTKYGRKHQFDYRYQSQAHALEYGFDAVGLGVLFGNHHLPIEEIDGLQEHAFQLHNQTGQWPARVCLPSAKFLTTIQVDIPYAVSSEENSYVKLNKILYALARLALPTVGIVSSERDDSSMLTELDNFATCTTLNVHPGVGDNIRYHEHTTQNQIHFEQAPRYSRNPKETIGHMKARGYNPWLMMT